MAKLSRADLARAERALARYGLLLRHDAVLPSFTALVVGAPFRGSWWSHPRTHEIYDLLQRFHRGGGVLFVKLINGKVTYVHRDLWPALLSAAGANATWQRRALSPAARAVLQRVRRAGALRTDQLEGLPSARRSAAIAELEARLLLHARDVHTETGAHRKLLRTWPRWCEDEGYAFVRRAPAEAQRELEAAAAALAEGGPARVRLPWSEDALGRARGRR